MYGQAGIILGGPRRRARPSRLAVHPAPRVQRAEGAAHANGRGLAQAPTAGTSSSSGRCGPVGSFSDKAFHEVLAGIDNRTTLLLAASPRDLNGYNFFNGLLGLHRLH